ncbi:MAG: ABC transporter ATP-binding protein [Planctomycetaceae bacterium]|jgi:zinc transport system ATP-binding protein|nr:ABC transporter ATP-binding protein [Planctomycetaceae bacterium]
MTNAATLTEITPPVIEFCGLDFTYNKDLVLENASVTIQAGDFVAIVGPNGGGKTTMLKLLLGLLKPNRGTIRLLGKPPEQSRTSVGYTPQHIQVDMQFPISVFDTVLMGRMRGGQRFQWRYSQADKQAAKDSLEIMRLSDKMKLPFRSLSGGQRQRVLIARAICGDPKILMLDEPTNNIDPQAEKILYDILRELNKRLTILLVSHDLGIVSNVVKSVICVNRTVAVHPTSELNGAMIRELYGTDVRFVRHDHRCSDHGRQDLLSEIR